VRERIEKEAQAEAGLMLERARREIAIAKETAVKELYIVSGGLAVDIASRIVARKLKEQDHRRLIEDSINEMNQLASGQNANA
jgi:F-type H+-transporting ATPase subunit b